MTTHLLVRSSLGSALALAAALTAGSIASAQSPLAIDMARITIAGTSNVHDYSACTTDTRLTHVQFWSGTAGAAFWDEVQKPGGLEALSDRRRCCVCPDSSALPAHLTPRADAGVVPGGARVEMPLCARNGVRQPNWRICPCELLKR